MLSVDPGDDVLDAIEVIGVIDLRGGAAVHARGGRREQYRPVEAVAGEPIRAGDASALARQYTERCGVDRLYVADLDAIEGRPAHTALVRSLAAFAPIWLDAGTAAVDEARRALDCGVERVIVGLETLPSLAVLESVCQGVGTDRIVFSLDLRNGTPIARAGTLARQSPEDLARGAVAAGAASVIVLDLGRVGAGAGLDLDLLARITSSLPGVDVYAGGGVRGADDLAQIRRAGCRGALVASALLDGRLALPLAGRARS